MKITPAQTARVEFLARVADKAVGIRFNRANH
jgi:hypothetical protein